MDAAKAALWAGQKEGRFFARIDVTTMLNGATLAVPLHVVTGRHPGPTFGIVTNTHGDEFLPTMAIRQFIRGLETEHLSGRLVRADPAVALSAGGRARRRPTRAGVEGYLTV